MARTDAAEAVFLRAGRRYHVAITFRSRRMTAATTCYWCWHCLGAVDAYRTWAGDTHRCPQCHLRVQRVPLATLRFFSFLGDDASGDERLRRARQAGAGRRQGAYGTQPGEDSARFRHGGRFEWSAGSRAGDGRSVGRTAAVLSRVEALDLLGLDDPATDAEVRAAFRRLAKRHHPDLQATAEARAAAQAMMARLNAAYRRLMPGR